MCIRDSLPDQLPHDIHANTHRQHHNARLRQRRLLLCRPHILLQRAHDSSQLLRPPFLCLHHHLQSLKRRLQIRHRLSHSSDLLARAVVEKRHRKRQFLLFRRTMRVCGLIVSSHLHNSYKGWNSGDTASGTVSARRCSCFTSAFSSWTAALMIRTTSSHSPSSTRRRRLRFQLRRLRIDKQTDEPSSHSSYRYRRRGTRSSCRWSHRGANSPTPRAHIYLALLSLTHFVHVATSTGNTWSSLLSDALK